MFNSISNARVGKYLLFATTILLASTRLSSGAANPLEFGDKAEVQAENDSKVLIAVASASKAWKDAFNRGDAAGAAAMYEDNAVMVVKPFGMFTGKKEILAFWTDLIAKGFDNIVYRNTVATILDGQSARLASDWQMNNAHGTITNELWVIQPDGRALLREDHFEVSK